MKFDLKRMKERHLLLLTLVVVCVIVGGLGAVLYLGFGRFAELKAEVASVQTELNRVANRVDQIKTLTKELQEWDRTAGDYARILPDHANKEELLEVFSEVKNETGVKISSMKINEEDLRRANRASKGSKSAEEPDVQKVTFQLSLESDYFQFGKFVNLLETYPRFMAVSEFSLGEPDEELTHGITLTGCTYKYLGATAAKPESKAAGRSARAKPEAK